MKAITLTQPWATLVAIRAKKIETRSWATAYTGPLAIHSAKSFPDWARRLCQHEPFDAALDRFKLIADDLPLGYVIATCRLAKVEQINLFTELPPDPEYSFGDYSVGRFMFHLEEVKMLEVPVPARGALGLWEWA